MPIFKGTVAQPLEIPEPLGLSNVPRSIQGVPPPNYVVAATQMIEQKDENGKPLAQIDDESDRDFVTFRFQVSRRLLVEGDLHYRKVDGRLVTAVQEVLARKVTDALSDPKHVEEYEYQNALLKASVKEQRQGKRRLPDMNWGWVERKQDGTTTHTCMNPELQYIVENSKDPLLSAALYDDEETAYANSDWYADSIAYCCYRDAPLQDHFDASDLTDADFMQADTEHANRALKAILSYGMVDKLTLPRNFNGTIYLDNPATQMENADWIAIQAHPLKLDMDKGQDVYSLSMHDGCMINITNEGSWWIDDTNGKRVYNRAPQRGFNPYMNTSDMMEQFMADMAEMGFTQDQFLRLPTEVFINWLILRAAEHDGDEVPSDIVSPSEHPATLRITEQPRCLHCGVEIPQERVAKGIQFCSQAHAVAYMEQQGVD